MAIITSNSFRGLWAKLTGTDRWTGAPSTQTRIGSFNVGEPQYENVSGQEREIFQTTGPLASVIIKKADMKANGVWKHYRKTNSDTPDIEIENSPYVNLLNLPNPLQSKNEFLFDMSLNKDIFGINYTFKDGGILSNGVPTSLFNVPPELLTPKFTGKIIRQRDIDKIVAGFIFAQGTTAQMSLKPEEILMRRKSLGNYGVVPVSPLSVLYMEISNMRAAMGLRNVVFRKKGAIGFISSEKKDAEGTLPLTPIERKEMEEAYTKQYGIGDRQSKVIIASTPMKWEPMTYPLKDMEAYTEVQEDFRRIVDFYGLNENIFSREKGATFTNVLEGLRMAYQDVIIPESEDDAYAMSRFLGLDTDREYLYLDFSHVPAMKENEEARSRVLSNKAMAFERLAKNGVDSTSALKITGLDKDLEG